MPGVRRNVLLLSVWAMPFTKVSPNSDRGACLQHHRRAFLQYGLLNAQLVEAVRQGQSCDGAAYDNDLKC